jgi:hypothetical protein
MVSTPFGPVPDKGRDHTVSPERRICKATVLALLPLHHQLGVGKGSIMMLSPPIKTSKKQIHGLVCDNNHLLSVNNSLNPKNQIHGLHSKCLPMVSGSNHNTILNLNNNINPQLRDLVKDECQLHLMRMKRWIWMITWMKNRMGRMNSMVELKLGRGLVDLGRAESGWKISEHSA